MGAIVTAQTTIDTQVIPQEIYITRSAIKSIDFGAKLDVCYLEYDMDAVNVNDLKGKKIEKTNSLVVVNCKNVFTLWISTSDGTLFPIYSIDDANSLISKTHVQKTAIVEYATSSREINNT